MLLTPFLPSQSWVSKEPLVALVHSSSNPFTRLWLRSPKIWVTRAYGLTLWRSRCQYYICMYIYIYIFVASYFGPVLTSWLGVFRWYPNVCCSISAFVTSPHTISPLKEHNSTAYTGQHRPKHSSNSVDPPGFANQHGTQGSVAAEEKAHCLVMVQAGECQL